MSLNEPYLDGGRHLFTDNYYMSLALAEQLNSRKTHFTGTLNRKRKGIPKSILQKILKKGEYLNQFSKKTLRKVN